MDEEVAIINEKTRNERIKNFFIENKKLLVSGICIVVLLLLGFFSLKMYQDSQIEKLSNKFNNAIIQFNNGKKNKIIEEMIEVIENEDSTYSPLALYFLIDNNLVDNRKNINEYFDILIDRTTLDKEIKNLIIYKKALYNADFISEKELLDTLKPIINSDSVWKSHALYLVAEYFYSKNEKQKSKEFFNQIISIKNANQDILKETRKRLSRDLSE